MFWRKKRKREQDLERELQSHLELEAEAQGENAATPDEARNAARRALGNTAQIKEATREAWGWRGLERLTQDVRYALRGMRRNPGFTLVAVLSLGLGIGANTAIFTFVNAALLKPLPYVDPASIVALQERQPKSGELTLVHPRSFIEWHTRSRSFEALAILQAIPMNTAGADGPEEVRGMWITPEMFRVFGVSPVLGRELTEEGMRPGATSSVLISYGYWQRRFASNPDIVGGTIRLQNQTGIIRGVMPPGFKAGTLTPDIYSLMPLNRNRPEAVGSRAFQCYGRLRPGITLDAVRAEMNVISAQIAHDFKGYEGWSVSVVGMRDYMAQSGRRILLFLMGVVTLVLLIACANVAGLVLTRGVGRRKELALRTSLGATWRRLLRQLLIESVVLSLAGGAAGLLLGWWASKALVLLAKDAVSFGQIADAGLDWRVLVFTIALSVITGIVFGLAPALQLSQFQLESALRGQSALRGHGAGIRGQQGFRSALVVGEVAMAVVLLVGAGLLVRTFSAMLSVKLGFQPEQVLTMRTFVLGDAPRRAALIDGMRDRVAALPDVLAVGTIQFLPLSGMTNSGPFRVIGWPDEGAARNRQADTATVSRGYFSAMGIPIVRGRAFGPQDKLGAKRVTLVNQAFVNKFFPREDPIGRLAVGDWSSPTPAEIVGVVGDIRHDALTSEPHATFYLSQAQSPGYITYLVVRTRAQPQDLAAAIRREVAKVDPTQPLTDVKPMKSYISAGLARPRLYAVLVGTFSTLALLLAAIGLYGIMAYSVNQRTHEIGVRMALGARPGVVLRSIIGHGAQLAALGLAIGVVGAMLLSRFVASFLYGVLPGDALTYAAVIAVLGGVALIAAYLPARRASLVDPMVALRYE